MNQDNAFFYVQQEGDVHNKQPDTSEGTRRGVTVQNQMDVCSVVTKSLIPSFIQNIRVLFWSPDLPEASILPRARHVIISTVSVFVMKGILCQQKPLTNLNKSKCSREITHWEHLQTFQLCSGFQTTCE